MRSSSSPLRMFNFFFFSSRRRHTRFKCDWSSDVCSSDLALHGFSIDTEDLRRLEDFATETFGASENHFTGFRLLLGKDERHTGFKDSSFFGGDFAQRMTEEVLVIEIDAGGDGDDRRNNGGGIEAAAEADFEDGKVHALAGKMFECHGRHAFEISRVGAEFACGEEFFDEDLDFSEGFGGGFVVDLLAAGADAL